MGGERGGSHIYLSDFIAWLGADRRATRCGVVEAFGERHGESIRLSRGHPRSSPGFHQHLVFEGDDVFLSVPKREARFIGKGKILGEVSQALSPRLVATSRDSSAIPGD